MEKMCIVCKDVPAMKGRRYCHSCYLNRRSVFYLKNGGNSTKKRFGLGICTLCNKEIKLNHKNQKYCLTCSYKISKIGNDTTSNYKKSYKSSRDYHRDIAEQVLGRKLSYYEVVHHFNGDISNNSVDNLIVISRSQHGKLHQFIREQRASIEKSIGEQDENCWKTLIAQMTTTWLETASVKVIKLSEIGQSAAEPLSNEEGSETMHVPPKATSYGDDIVQTSTS